MFRRVALTFLVLQGLASTVAWACSCAGGGMGDAPVLFIGAPTHTARGCGGDTFHDHVTTFEVTDVCNGEVKDTVRVWHGTSGASCGVEFPPDMIHAVAAEVDEQGRLVTSLCIGSFPARAPDCETAGF